MRRLALVLVLGLVMVGLQLAAAGEASGVSNDAPSASYELVADVPAGFSEETSVLFGEGPSMQPLDQMRADYMYDAPGAACSAAIAPGIAGSPFSQAPGSANGLAVMANVVSDAATTPAVLTYTPSGPARFGGHSADDLARAASAA